MKQKEIKIGDELYKNPHNVELGEDHKCVKCHQFHVVNVKTKTIEDCSTIPNQDLTPIPEKKPSLFEKVKELKKLGAVFDKKWLKKFEQENEPILNCQLDGDALCIFGDDFEDLMVSPSMFVELTDEQLKEFKTLIKELNK